MASVTAAPAAYAAVVAPMPTNCGETNTKLVQTNVMNTAGSSATHSPRRMRLNHATIIHSVITDSA